MRPAPVMVALLLWFVAAVVIVGTGLLARAPVPPPAIGGALAVLAVLVGVFHPSARERVRTADLRYFIAPHLVRFVGIAFLLMVSRGMLARAFVPIGWGDAISALGAVLLLATRPRLSSTAGWWSVFAWNCVGSLDMLVLIGTGLRLASADPEQFAIFRRLPFGLLPTFFVPLIIASHVFIFLRLFQRGQTPSRVC